MNIVELAIVAAVIIPVAGLLWRRFADDRREYRRNVGRKFLGYKTK